MFSIQDFSECLDEQNAALESVLTDLDSGLVDFDEAMEGLFSKPKPVAKLLANLNKMINKNCKSAADCDDLLEKLGAEEAEFNGALDAMKSAAQELQAGSIDKKEMKARIKAEVKKLKKTCDILKLKDINNQTDNITDEELQNLRDFLVGAKEAINNKKSELGETAEEGYMSYLDDAWDQLGSDSDDIATEAIGVGAIVIGEFALTLIAMAIGLRHSGLITDKKTINHVKKRLKPAMKAAKNKLKIAKRAQKWGDCIKALKEMDKLNDQLYAIVKKLTPLRESDVEIHSSTGEVKKKKIKNFNIVLKRAADKYKKEKEFIAKKIQFYTEKQKTGASESATFMEGYEAGMEAAMVAMTDDEEIFGLTDMDDDFSAFESDLDFGDLLADDDDDDFGIIM